MTKMCRICGSVWPFPSHYWITDGGGCRTCGGSPLCDQCGHPRADHVAVYAKGERQCKFRAVDVQSLSHLPCACTSYTPVEGRLANASFAAPDSGPLPRLRFGETLRPTEPEPPARREAVVIRRLGQLA